MARLSQSALMTVTPQFTTIELYEDAIGGPAALDFQVTNDNVDPGEIGVTITQGQFGLVTSSAPDSPSTIVRYQLDNSFDAVQMLAAGEVLNDTFNVVSKDGTITKIISVIIHGSDGAPIAGSDGSDPLLIGTRDRETIDGKAGNDIISGHLDRDTLIGGDGDDRYSLGSYVPTEIIEGSGASSGTDTITSTISRSLLTYANVENLVLLGSAPITGTGNELANTLDGAQNTGANVLTGLAGNDVYFVGDGDTVVELVGGGQDTVYASVAQTLAANVENLVLRRHRRDHRYRQRTWQSAQRFAKQCCQFLVGLGGNDVYVVGVGDTIVEAVGGGTDIVGSFADHTLAANVENLDSSWRRGDFGYGQRPCEHN